MSLILKVKKSLHPNTQVLLGFQLETNMFSKHHIARVGREASFVIFKTERNFKEFDFN